MTLTRRHLTKEKIRYTPLTDYDENLPYGGKVILAKKKKPDSWVIVVIEISAFLFVIGLLYYSYYYFDHMHFHITHFYAKIGHSYAQHAIGQKYLDGKGVERNHTAAFQWFRKAADQGHPHSSYNLAVGHLQGFRTDVKPGEAHDLIKHAAENGVEEAHEILQKVCSIGHCDH